MNARLKAAIQHWCYVAPVLQPASNEKEYTALVEALDAVLDAGGADETHTLAQLAGYLGELIAEYDERHYPIVNAEPREALRLLIEQNNLQQKDLAAELGSQSVVSEILNGKREINARQAKALGVRFAVSPGAFL